LLGKGNIVLKGANYYKSLTLYPSPLFKGRGKFFIEGIFPLLLPLS
jgi:hypothetical protein